LARAAATHTGRAAGVGGATDAARNAFLVAWRPCASRCWRHASRAACARCSAMLWRAPRAWLAEPPPPPVSATAAPPLARRRRDSSSSSSGGGGGGGSSSSRRRRSGSGGGVSGVSVCLMPHSRSWLPPSPAAASSSLPSSLSPLQPPPPPCHRCIVRLTVLTVGLRGHGHGPRRDVLFGRARCVS
jgi:hypothetical protein